MKYFKFDYSLNEQIVGADYPQVHKFIKGYNPDGIESLYSLYKYKTSFPDYTPNLDGLMLAGYAKLTDFVSNGFSARFFILSAKAKLLFEQYNLCNHQFYSLGLYKQQKKYEYYLLNIISDYSNAVDYEKSSFVIYQIGNSRSCQEVNIESKDVFLLIDSKIKKEKGISWGVWSEKITLKNSLNDLDFFEIGKFDSNTYISERLKNAIEAAGLTGWEFTPATNLIVEE